MPSSRLVELYAHRIGVIDEIRLDFGEGFTVITGETGAGKTLLLGALALCLGRDNVASRFALSGDSHVSALLLKNGEEVLVSREMTASGRLRSSLNRTPASAETLRTLTQDVVAVHGQHESLNLARREVVLSYIDSSDGDDAIELGRVRLRLRDLRAERRALGGDEFERGREADLLRAHLAELERAKLEDPGELVKVLDELTRLTQLRDGQAELASAIELFDGETDDTALSRFAHAIQVIPQGDAYDLARGALTSALIQSREALRELALLADPDVIDASAIAQLEDRVNTLQLISRKFGGTLESAIAERSRFRERLGALGGLDGDVARLDADLVQLDAQEAELEVRVRQQRVESARRLTVAVSEQLARVALASASVRFSVDGDDGSDVQILFSANPGLPEGPLSLLASGGELSRILLALSLVGTDNEAVAVFDEIDAGLGGQVAQQIGECLSELGRRQQVIAVTHLASVAARADHHFVIEKTLREGVTLTSIRPVVGVERVRELARMLAGDDVTEESYALAQRLLQDSRDVRLNPGESR